MSAGGCGRDPLRDARGHSRRPDCALNHGFMNVVPSVFARMMQVPPGRWKDVLPAPVLPGGRRLPLERVGQRRLPRPSGQIALVQPANPLKMTLEVGRERARQDDHPVLFHPSPAGPGSRLRQVHILHLS